jgi:ribosomal protein S27AE
LIIAPEIGVVEMPPFLQTVWKWLLRLFRTDHRYSVRFCIKCGSQILTDKKGRRYCPKCGDYY